MINPTQATVSAFYLAYYGRPADPAGLAYWTAVLDLANGNFSAIIDSFANSEESAARFGSLSTEARIAQIYQQVLGRSPETEGKNYWADQVNKGAVTVAELAITIMSNALNEDKATVQNREQAADAFTARVESQGIPYSGLAAVEAARLVINAIKSTTTADDVSALVQAGTRLTETASAHPAVIDTLKGSSSLVDLLNTDAGARDPLALIKLVTTIASTAGDDATSVNKLIGSGTLAEVVNKLPQSATVADLDDAIVKGGFVAGEEILNPTKPAATPEPASDPAPTPVQTHASAAIINGVLTISGNLADGDLFVSLNDQTCWIGEEQQVTISGTGPFTDVNASGYTGGKVTVSIDQASVDVSALSLAGVDAINLHPYALKSATLTGAQAKIASTFGAPGYLPNCGAITVIAGAAGEDLSGLTLDYNDNLILTAGKNYVLNAGEMARTKVGANGTLGDVTAAGNVTVIGAANGAFGKNPASLKATQGVDTLIGTVAGYQVYRSTLLYTGDISQLPANLLDPLDKLVLTDGGPYVLSTAQMARTQIGLNGTPGQLTGTADVTVIGSLTDIQTQATTLKAAGADHLAADLTTNGGDLSATDLTNIDRILLSFNSSYTLTGAQAKMAMLNGSPNYGGMDPAYTGWLTHPQGVSCTITINASATGEDLSGLVLDSRDTLVLTAGQNYSLTASALSRAKIGAAGTTGNVTDSGTITVVDKLSAIALASGGGIPPQQGAAYLKAQGADAVYATSNGGNISSYSITGIDKLVLAAGKDHTLTAAQAAVAQMGMDGTAGTLTDSGKTSVVDTLANLTPTVVSTLKANGVDFVTATVAATTPDISAIDLSMVDVIRLVQNTACTLTGAQAAKVQYFDSAPPGYLPWSGGKLTVIASDQGEDLSGLYTISDHIVLTAGADYVLTLAEAAYATVGTGTTGDFSTAGNITLVAGNRGEDLTQLKATHVDSIVLTAGRDYTLTAAQAAIAKFGMTGTPGALSDSGQITVVVPAADATPSAVSALKAKGVDVVVAAAPTGTSPVDISATDFGSADLILLNPATSYVLTSAQAAHAVRYLGDTPGNIVGNTTDTLKATTADLSGVRGDFSAIILSAGQDCTLTLEQALYAKVGETGTSRDLSGAGVITVKADRWDLTGYGVTGIDSLELDDVEDYVLPQDLAAVAKIGATGKPGDLTSTGNITVVIDTLNNLASGAATALHGKGADKVIAAVSSGDVSSFAVSGIDEISINQTGALTLSSDQAKIGKIAGTNQLLGNLTHPGTASITIKAKAGTDDLSGLTLSTYDSIVLSDGGHYTLTKEEIALAKVDKSGTLGNAGDLTGTFVTLMAPTGGTDLTGYTIPAAVTSIVLTDGASYSLTPAQAEIARVGTGTPGDLAGTGTIKVMPNANGEDLSTYHFTGEDAIELQSIGSDYTLTAAQAMVTKTNGGTLGILPTAGTFTIKDTVAHLANGVATGLLSGSHNADIIVATAGAEDISGYSNLSGIPSIHLLDANGNATLSSAEAKIAYFTDPNQLGNLSAGCGAITVMADAAGEDLTTLKLTSQDKIVLADGQNYSYTLTAAEAAIAQFGANGTKGSLTSATTTIKIVDTVVNLAGGVATTLTNHGADSIEATVFNEDISAITDLSGISAIHLLDPDHASATLSSNEARITYLTNPTALGDLSYKCGAITIIAKATGEDLSGVKLSSELDTVVLTAGQAYTLNALEAADAKIGTGAKGNLTGATVTVADTESNLDMAVNLFAANFSSANKVVHQNCGAGPLSTTATADIYQFPFVVNASITGFTVGTDLVDLYFGNGANSGSDYVANFAMTSSGWATLKITFVGLAGTITDGTTLTTHAPLV